MRKALIPMILLSAWMPMSAWADPFAGWSVGGDLGVAVDLAETESTFTYRNLFAAAPDASDINRTKDSDSDADVEFASSVNVQYDQAINSRWYLGYAGAVHLEGDREVESGAYSFSNPNNRADIPRDYTVTTEIDPQAHLSVGVRPGYAWSDRTLAFVSVMYHYLEADLATRTSFDRSSLNATAVARDVSDEESFHGVGLGAGIKHNLNERWYVTLLAEWVWFGDQQIPGPSLTSSNDEITLTQDLEVQPSWVDVRAGIGFRF